MAKQKPGYKKIFTEVSLIEASYYDNPIMIMEMLPFKQFDMLKTCEFYSNSRYLKGNFDELQREKPFYNIVNYRVTLAKVATDLDVKDIRIEADQPKDWVRSMFLQHESYEWMKKENFAYFLNKAGLTRPKYGGVLIKKVELPKKLTIDVVDWRNVITDQIDILGGSIIEKHFFTPVELSKKAGVWENVDEAIKACANRKKFKGRGYTQEQYNSERIEVKEIHGEFPVAFLKEANQKEGYEIEYEDQISDEDYWIFSRQIYYISEIGEKCFIFNADTEKEHPYDYLPWEEMPGRGLGRGVIEDSEQAQVWTNDSVINEKNAMDLAGKVVAKTTDDELGNNMLTVDNGKIFKLHEGKEFEMMTLSPSALGEFKNQIDKWEKQANYATSSFEANTGEQPPSGTPYSSTALLNQVADKPFDYRREEMGVFITRIFEKWIIPFLIKKLYNSHMLTSEFSEEELAIIDNSFAIGKANKDLIQQVIKTGKVPTQGDYAGMIMQQKSKISGNKRSIKFPSGYFDDFVAKVTVMTTGEQKNKAAVLQSLSEILQTVAKSYNPQNGKFMILEDPRLAKIFGNIVELAGVDISPANIGIDGLSKSSTLNLPPPPPPPTPIVSPSAAAVAPTPVPTGAPAV